MVRNVHLSHWNVLSHHGIKHHWLLRVEHLLRIHHPLWVNHLLVDEMRLWLVALWLHLVEGDVLSMEVVVHASSDKGCVCVYVCE